MIDINAIRQRLDVLQAVFDVSNITVREGHRDGDQKKPKVYMVECGSSAVRNLGAFDDREDAQKQRDAIAALTAGVVDIVCCNAISSITAIMGEHVPGRVK